MVFEFGLSGKTSSKYFVRRAPLNPERGHPGRSSSDADQASDEPVHPTAAKPLRPGWPRSEDKFMGSLDLQPSDVHRDHEPEMPKS